MKFVKNIKFEHGFLGQLKVVLKKVPFCVFFMLVLFSPDLFSQSSASATYSSGNISTDSYFTSLPNVSACYGELTVNIPVGAVITSVDVQYTMTASSSGRMSHQRSQLKCVSTGGSEEATLASGVGNSTGTYSYSRTGLNIANNVKCGGNITFQLHAGRTSGGNGCGTGFNMVDNNTWKVTVHYKIPDEDTEFSKGSLSSIDSISSSKNSFGQRTLVLDVVFSDLGTADGFPTVIDSLSFTQGPYNQFADWTQFIEGATLYGPDLGETTGSELSGVVYANRIRFSGGNIISIADMNNETYQLKIWLKSNIASSNDNKKLDFELDADNIHTPVCLASSSFGDFNVYSGPIAMYFPRDTDSKIEEGDGARPSSIMATHASFGSRITVFDIKFIDLGTSDGGSSKVNKIVFTQGAGNEIINWTDVIDGVTLYGPQLGGLSGTEAFGVVDSNTITFSASQLFAIADGNTESYELRIWLNSNILTTYDTKRIEFELDYSKVTTTQSFSSIFGSGNVVSGEILLFPKSANSAIENASTSDPVKIYSSAICYATRTPAFNFKLKDMGNDGFSTKINELIFTQGDLNDVADWTNVIAGATLFGPDLGGASGSEMTGTVLSDEIRFASTAMIDITDSTSEEYVLKIWLVDNYLLDCDKIAFKLDNNNVSCDTLGSKFGAYAIESHPISLSFIKENDARLLAFNSYNNTSIASIKNDYASRQTVFDFKITDLGIDVYNTTVNKIVLRPKTGNNISKWTDLIAGVSLYGTALGDLAGSEILGTVDTNNITFDVPAMFTVVPGDTHSYQLKIWLKEDLSAITDNDTLVIGLSASDITVSACFSSAFSNSTVESGIVSVDIEATKLIFQINEPPLYVEKDNVFSVTVLAVDANNNFDVDASGSITLDIYSGNGVLSSATGLTQSLQNGTYTWNDITYNTVETFKISAESISFTNAISNNIFCVDEFSVVLQGDSVEPNKISSAVYAYNDRIMVFDVKLKDKGIADGLPTVIDEIIFTQGAFNQISDWRDAIAGASLFGPDLGEISGTELLGTIDSANITFSNAAMISIADSTNETYQLRIWLKTDLSNINDNDLLAFKLNYADITTASSNSTIFGQGIVESPGIKVYIAPVALKFEINKPPAIVGLLSDFEVTVHVVDMHGNYNKTATDSVQLSVYMGSGTLNAISGIHKPLINGSLTFNSIQYNHIQYFKIRASSPSLTHVVSDSILCLIDEDSELSAGVEILPLKINSYNSAFSSRVMVFDVTFSDMGTFDGLPTIIERIDFTHGAHNKVIDWRNAIDSASLYGYGLGVSFGTEYRAVADSGKITFADVGLITIPDGESHTYQLKIWLHKDLTGIYDKDTIDIKLSYTDITTAYASSKFGSGAVSTGPIRIEIVATRLTFHKNQPPSIVGFNYNFIVTARAVDDNGNLDTDATDVVTLSLYQGTGSFTTSVNMTQVLSGGIYTWHEAKYNEEGVFKLRVVANNLQQGLSGTILCKKCVRTGTYNSGRILTDRSFTALPGSSSCPGSMSIYMPSFAVITGVDVFYTMSTGATPGHKAHQRSQLRCVSPGGLSEPSLYSGIGAQGTHEYKRFNLNIADNVSVGANINFELHAGRTDKGSGCGHSFNYVENNSWTVVVNYIVTGAFWTGEVDNNWHNENNWGCEIIPNKDIDVYLTADAIRMPIISTDNAEVKSIEIEAGASLTISNSKSLFVSGDYTNNGIIETEAGFGRIIFNGDGQLPIGRQTVFEIADRNLYYLHVQSQAYAKLINDINISGDLIIDGTLEATNSKDINMTGLNTQFYVDGTGLFIPKNGSLNFVGRGNQLLKTNGSNIYKLNINTSNVADQVSMIDNVRVTNQLKLERGVLNLNRKILTISNSNKAAIDTTITNSGYIYAETAPVYNLDNLVKWVIGNNTGKYTVPFGKAHDKLTSMSLELTKNQMGDQGYLVFTTYATQSNNNPVPSLINHLGGNLEEVSPHMVDRYWFIDFLRPSKSDEAPIEGYITFTYLEEELDLVSEADMIAQRYNSKDDLWGDKLYTQHLFDAGAAQGYSTNSPVTTEKSYGTYTTSLIDESDFYNVWILTSEMHPLPIKLLYFEANCEGEKVALNWATATETNNHFFSVEKSIDGLKWDVIETVLGAHNSSTQKNYELYVPAQNEITYYRLRQTDFDGKNEVFAPIVVNCTHNKSDFGFMHYPNPVADILNVYLYNITDKEGCITVCDAHGKNVKVMYVNIEHKTNIPIEVTELPNGLYFISFKSNNYFKTEKFMKLQK